MFRRRQPVDHRGPGLARTVARTAVIAGTATATSNVVTARQAARHQEADRQASERQDVVRLQQQVDQLQAQTIQSQMQPAAAPASGDELIAQLARLGELHQQGILSADEFAQAKARLLNG